MSRSDVLKSLLRAGADRAAQELERVAPLSALRRVIRELKDQRMSIPDKALTSAVAHGPDVVSVSISSRRGAIGVDASFKDSSLHCALIPLSVRFAAQGAKELTFRVEPQEAAANPRSRQVAASIAEAIAHAVWPFALGRPPERTGNTIVDRDGTDAIRIDMRNIAAMRQLKGPAMMTVELFAIERLEPNEGSLTVKMKLPPLAL